MTPNRSLSNKERSFERLLIKTNNQKLILSYKEFKKEIISTFELVGHVNKMLIKRSKIKIK